VFSHVVSCSQAPDQACVLISRLVPVDLYYGLSESTTCSPVLNGVEPPRGGRNQSLISAPSLPPKCKEVCLLRIIWSLPRVFQNHVWKKVRLSAMAPHCVVAAALAKCSTPPTCYIHPIRPAPGPATASIATMGAHRWPLPGTSNQTQQLIQMSGSTTTPPTHARHAHATPAIYRPPHDHVPKLSTALPHTWIGYSWDIRLGIRPALREVQETHQIQISRD
jgi:hypothetical protein